MAGQAQKKNSNGLAVNMNLNVGNIDVVSITVTGSLNIGETRVVRVIIPPKDTGEQTKENKRGDHDA